MQESEINKINSNIGNFVLIIVVLQNAVYSICIYLCLE